MLTRMYTLVPVTTPESKARGKVRPGSRTSPAILLTSHQPPKEKNARTKPAARAGRIGRDPGRRATKGTKFDHAPRRKAMAQIVSSANTPSFNQVIHRKNPALRRMLSMFIKQSAQITVAAASFTARLEDQWKI